MLEYCGRGDLLLFKSVCVSREIWERFVQFEGEVGDLNSLLKMEKRRAGTIKSEVRSHIPLVVVQKDIQNVRRKLPFFGTRHFP